jgi:hypothetical protein
MAAPASFLPDWNQVNAIYRPAAGCETLCRGFNQGIYLGGIETGTTSIQFKIGFHHQDCFNTLFVYFNRRPDGFDVGTLDGHNIHSLFSVKHSTLISRDVWASAPGA